MAWWHLMLLPTSIWPTDQTCHLGQLMQLQDDWQGHTAPHTPFARTISAPSLLCICCVKNLPTSSSVTCRSTRKVSQKLFIYLPTCISGAINSFLVLVFFFFRKRAVHSFHLADRCGSFSLGFCVKLIVKEDLINWIGLERAGLGRRLGSPIEVSWRKQGDSSWNVLLLNSKSEQCDLACVCPVTRRQSLWPPPRGQEDNTLSGGGGGRRSKKNSFFQALFIMYYPPFQYYLYWGQEVDFIHKYMLFIPTGLALHGL